LLAEIDTYAKLLYKDRSERQVQTDDSAIQDYIAMEEEFQRCKEGVRGRQRETEQLKESLMRQGAEIERLIEEKRELEDLVDQ